MQSTQFASRSKFLFGLQVYPSAPAEGFLKINLNCFLASKGELIYFKVMDKYLVALVALPKMTPTRLRKLLEKYSPEAAWKCDADEWIECGLKNDFVSEVFVAKKKTDPDYEKEKLEKIGADLVHENDENFPAQLKNISSAPAWLYRRGETACDEKHCITIVGPRKISNYGKQVTEHFAEALSRFGFTIISGLALGVDAAAHQAALRMNMPTVGVLGCGIDQLYPPQNRELGKNILASGGMILSEFPPGTEPAREHFPMRNRIVSGLARAALIVEAGEKSGALITAGMALSQGKDVFAVPGSIFSETSGGTNKIIKSGQAQAVTSPEEVLEAMGLNDVPSFRERSELKPTNPDELRLYEIMDLNPTHIDDIIKKSGMNSAKVSAILSMLEMKGFVSDTGGMNYVKK